MIEADDIKKQAEIIRNIAQKVIDACDNKTPIEVYSRNKISSGSLAQDAAVLAVLLTQYEAEEA